MLPNSLVCRALNVERTLTDAEVMQPVIDGIPAVYVDNFIYIASEATSCMSARERVQAGCDKLRLPTHGVVDPCRESDVLGWSIDLRKGEVRPKGARSQRLWVALSHLLAKPFASPKHIEKLTGHMVFMSLIRRPVMSVLQSVYRFIHGSVKKDRVQWIPLQVQRELRQFRDLIPLCCANLKSKTSQIITCSDASPWGYGVCAARNSSDEIRELGRFKERWRFAGAVHLSHRERALESAAWETSSPEVLAHTRQVVDVPIMEGSPLGLSWSNICSGPWRFKEHISLLEARALVKGIRWALVHSEEFQARHVFLVDNLGVALAVERGRSSRHGMCTALQHVAALLLSFGSSGSLRWIPSEVNVADAASRRGYARAAAPRAKVPSASTVFQPGAAPVMSRLS
eukprot:6459479-Amphidinium_carterae.1